MTTQDEEERVEEKTTLTHHFKLAVSSASIALIKSFCQFN
jgi:hypothetical protein